MDDDKDFDYVPPTDLSLEEAEDDIEEYEGSSSSTTHVLKRYRTLFVCFFFLFFADGFHFLFVKIWVNYCRFVALNQCRRCQNPQEIFGVFCLLRRKGAPLLLFSKDNPNTIAQVGDKRCSEIF